MTETHTPLVSVIVPTFNQKPEYLRATIRSVLAQDFDDFELVVSDNHSIAETAAVMNEFDDERLHVVHPPEHLPMIPHFSFAAEQGRGKYLSFLPSDDLVEPDWLSTLVPAIERDEDASFAFGEIMGVVHDAPETVLYTCRDNKLASGTYDPEFLLK
ncbi:MAG: glycosyltransferase family A protein, partial [Pseudomonadota bacterium]